MKLNLRPIAHIPAIIQSLSQEARRLLRDRLIATCPTCRETPGGPAAPCPSCCARLGQMGSLHAVEEFLSQPA